jgi:hypothetical protein
MRGRAVRRPAQDGQVAVLTRPRRAASARRPLVAWLGHVLEVRAAGALEQVAADGSRVPQLPGRPGQHGLRQHRVPGAHPRVGGQVAVAHPGADPQPAPLSLIAALSRVLDGVREQPGHVDEQVGGGHPELHQVDQVGPAGQEGSPGPSRHEGDRGRRS